MESLSYLSFKGDILEIYALASNFSLPCVMERRKRRKKGWVAGNGVRRGSHGLLYTVRAHWEVIIRKVKASILF